MLNEHEFPPLSNACQRILSNISQSRFINMNLLVIRNLLMSTLSPIYAGSVSEFVTPLNISKPVFTSIATKCDVCNASSVS